VSVTDSILSFLTGTYAVTRAATGSYSGGRYSAGSTTTFNIDAVIQPATGRVLDSLPEAQRGGEVRSIWTLTELRTRTPSSAPDVVTIDGEAWVVTTVKRWESFDPTYYFALALRGVQP
jgi:hypothetical protein